METTKQQLNNALSKSEEITRLMNQISQSTVQQTESAEEVSSLMQQATQSSQARSQASTQIAQAIREPAAASATLQASVEQFKVAK